MTNGNYSIVSLFSKSTFRIVFHLESILNIIYFLTNIQNMNSYACHYSKRKMQKAFLYTTREVGVTFKVKIQKWDSYRLSCFIKSHFYDQV